MKLITAFLHYVRVNNVVDSLNDAGYRNLILQDVRGTLSPLDEFERVYSAEARLVISEAKLSIACSDAEVESITTIIRDAGKIGDEICGWVYISPIEQVLPIGGGSYSPL